MEERNVKQAKIVQEKVSELQAYITQQTSAYLRKYGDATERKRTRILGVTSSSRESFGTQFFKRTHTDAPEARKLQILTKELDGIQDKKAILEKIREIYKAIPNFSEMKFNKLEEFTSEILFALNPKLKEAAAKVSYEVGKSVLSPSAGPKNMLTILNGQEGEGLSTEQKILLINCNGNLSKDREALQNLIWVELGKPREKAGLDL